MKRFICLMIFAIGLFVSLPATSSGNGSPPDQVNIVQYHPVDFTAMVINQEVKVFKVSKEPNWEFGVVNRIEKEGGFVADQGLFLEKQFTWLNNKNATSNLSASNMVRNYDFRLCRYTKLNESQIITKNIESITRCTIRADSQV